MRVNSCTGFVPGTQISRLRNSISVFFCKYFKHLVFQKTSERLLERAGAPGLFSGTGLEGLPAELGGSGVAKGLQEPLRGPPHVSALPGRVAQLIAPTCRAKPRDPCGEGCSGSQADLWVCFL